MKTPTSIPVATATDSPRLSGDDLEEIVAQRAEEIRRFRLAGVSIPTLKAGEEIRVVEADFSAARMHAHLPENEIQAEIVDAIASAMETPATLVLGPPALVTLEAEADSDLWRKRASRARSRRQFSESLRPFVARFPRRPNAHGVLRSPRADRVRRPRPEPEAPGARAEHESTPERQASLRLSAAARALWNLFRRAMCSRVPRLLKG
ncbi:hypothetical protein [Burkholderia vietnamiensis]|uniref:hypothetical protein n=1 Tax=Burkholderia vietnamiensis TaxID=60552 RepID=UPI00104100B6|nr:hypothetical protein [Burkholderia vietnamiensis]